MSENTNNLRKQTLAKLKELFQMDQPDLDFGIYRIMHARQEEISDFLDNDLLATIDAAFDCATQNKAQSEYETALANVKQHLGEEALDSKGILNESFANTPAGKQYLEAQKKLVKSKQNVNGADSVYSDLLKFFSRYYDKGDFVSRRYHTRETANMAQPYAIPYGGEEVKLHWANADQYYVKTTENFRNYVFDPKMSTDIPAELQDNAAWNDVQEGQYKVHFQVVDAEEGEHDDVKASDNQARYFFVANDKPVSFTGNELIVNFEYRTLRKDDINEINENDVKDVEHAPSKDVIKEEKTTASKKKDSKQKRKVPPARAKELKERFGGSEKASIKVEELILLDMVAKILDVTTALGGIPDALKQLVALNVSTENDNLKNRPLLLKYLRKYVASNKSDYFIHKNLKQFLKREMDFYIKNEIMCLDDIESADARAVENYLVRIKVFRAIAGKIIDFLGQLEDFQKKLWLKKKFIVQCDYCITLDRVKPEFYQDIFSNEKQLQAWRDLRFPEDCFKAPEQIPNNPDDLLDQSTHWSPSAYLMVDTKCFSREFKQKLIASIDDLDENCDGLLIHSENFQALNLLQERYREQVKCVYIDPPYNTGKNDFIYKDAYQHSSWMTMMNDRMLLSSAFLNENGVLFSSIDDHEQDNLLVLCKNIYTEKVEQYIWCLQDMEETTFVKTAQGTVRKEHEYIITCSNDSKIRFKKYPGNTNYKDGSYQNPDNDPRGKWFSANISRNGISSTTGSKYFTITTPSGKQFSRNWTLSPEEFDEAVKNKRIYFGPKGSNVPRYKIFETDPVELIQSSLFTDVHTSVTGKNALKALFGYETSVKFPKPPSLIQRLIQISSEKSSFIFDYFSGSGTTAQAVIDVNRSDDGERKYILVEMGEYFNTILKPRIEKVVFAPQWKEGNPMASKDTYNGISHCFKYMRLESYEDTLNNLTLQAPKITKGNSTPELYQDYVLNYMLDVESKDSLLNLGIFSNPFGGHKLKIKQPGSDASVEMPVDIIETFNYLIGLRVERCYDCRSYTAEFIAPPDPELPNDSKRRLQLKGAPQSGTTWSFQSIVGWIPANPRSPNNGQKKNVLVIWRNLTEDRQKDNVMLDWYIKEREKIDLNARKSADYDLIYVNGSSNSGPDIEEEKSLCPVLPLEKAFFDAMWKEENI